MLREAVRLGSLTTLGVGGAADEFHAPETVEQVLDVVADCRRRGVPWRVLGRGSNLVVDDAGVRGAVLHTRALRELRIETEGRVVAGAGLPTSVLLQRATAAGLGGLESLVGYPATIGGAARMNAGGRWGEVGERIEAVQVVRCDGTWARVPVSECDFGYRTSALGGSFVVAVELRLPSVDVETYRGRTARIQAEKAAVQPLGERSAGCMFRNPEGASAGRVVDELGLKGLRRGDAQVSTRHGNFLVNRGAARSADVLRVIDAVRSAVARELGIELVQEVEVWR